MLGRWDPPPLTRLDLLVAAALAAASAGLFATTFSGQVAVGDSPESVAGIESLGILHAPGYPAYVLLARLFAEVVRVGDMTLRANLFSLVCAAAAVGVVYVLGRLVGSGRWGASVGALSLATATSFWFYAGYAKFYSLTALLIAASLALTLAWRHDGRTGWLVGAGLSVGVASGAAWQAAAMVVPALLVLALVGVERPRWRAVVAATAAAGLVTVALLGFVLVRAGQDPAVNWGGADSPDRLIELVRADDFDLTGKLLVGPAAARPAGQSGDGEDASGGSTSVGARSKLDPSRIGQQIERHAQLLVRETSLLLAVAAVVGLGLLVWRRRVVGLALIVALALNLVATLLLGVGPVRGFTSGLRYGGFLLTASVVLAVGVGVAVSELLRVVGSRLTPTPDRRSDGPVEPSPWFTVAGGAVVAAVVLVPPAIAHAEAADHDTPAFASDYATNVFSHVPDDGVLLVYGAERAFPLWHHQIVLGRDVGVDVVIVNQLGREWYAEQVEQRLGQRVPAPRGDGSAFAEAVAALDAERPVLLDLAASVNLRNVLAFEPGGLVAEVVEGERPGPVPVGPEVFEKAMEGYAKDGIFSHPARRRWPSDQLVDLYAFVEVEAASARFREGDLESAIRHSEIALLIDPTNRLARDNLRQVRELLERTRS